MILTLDPSSTRCGYCFADLPEGRTLPVLHEMGILTPSNSKAKAIERGRSLADQAQVLAREHPFEKIIIETPADKPPRQLRGSRKKPPKYQAKYGVAVGQVTDRLERAFGVEKVICVAADQWTQTEKKKRAADVAARYPDYDITQDKGLDAADAIGIADWYFTQLQQRALRKALEA